jgi:hypothetical protein
MYFAAVSKIACIEYFQRRAKDYPDQSVDLSGGEPKVPICGFALISGVARTVVIEKAWIFRLGGRQS